MKADNIDQNFTCMICTELANDAVQTFCCGQIMCEKCSIDLQEKQHSTCPYCREQLSVRPSSLARRMISNMKIPCKYECGQNIQHKQLKIHQRRCPQKKLKCTICEKELRQKNLVEHMKDDHAQKLYQMCLDFQLGPEDTSSSKVSSNASTLSSKIQESKIKNSKGKFSQLGLSGKYYCGGKLIGICGCCDGNCGPSNGENCDECMAADLKRYNLPKGYLVNTDGVPCQFDKKSKLYSCGRNMKSFICDPKNKICIQCAKVTKAIKLGRYAQLI